MKKITGAFLTFLFLSATVQAPGQGQNEDLHFERISLEQGLSQSMVFCITQDREGMMWFGTEDGLNKYDGYEFTVYRHRDPDTNSLSGSNIRCLAVDSAGNLWIGTWDAGLNRYDPLRERFVRYRHDPGDPHSLSDDRVVSILPDSGGIVWVSTWGGGLNRYDGATGRFTHFRHQDADSASISTDALYALSRDRKGAMWIGSFLGGLNRYDQPTGTFTRFRHRPGDSGSLSDDRVTSTIEDSRSNVWVGTWGGGLNRFDPRTETFAAYRYDPKKPSGLGADIVSSLCLDDEGNLWVGTMGGGLNCYDPARDRFAHYRTHPFKSWTISNDRVLSLFRDRGGLLWIGTGNGICKYDKRRNQFRLHVSDPNDPSSLSGNEVFPIWEDMQGRVWVGTFGEGLNRFDRATGMFRRFRHDPADRKSLSNDRVYALYEDENGTMWIGTDGGGLDRMDGDSFVHYRFDPANPGGINNDYIRCITGDRLGNIWVGTQSWGLNCFDPRSGTFSHFRHNPADPGSVSGDEIMCMLVDRSGALWVGATKGGLNRFDPERQQFVHTAELKNGSDSLGHDDPQVIQEDRNGMLWIGTMGGGLYGFDPKRNSTVCYQEESGLPSVTIYGILEDTAGALWLTTNNGLSRFIPSKGTVRNYTVAHGLQSNEFNANAYHRGRSGIFYVGGVHGYNEFRPENIRDNPVPPPVVITSFQIFGNPVPFYEALGENGRLVLDYAQNYFSIEFAALDYSAPQRNEYAYKMEGWDKTWIPARKGRQATYTNLDPGSYVFRVRGSNNSGIWNESGISLPVVILPPFWKTWWFRSLAALALAALLYYFHRLGVTRILELEKMRVRIASDLHDDIGSTLTRIVVQSETIQKEDDRASVRSTAGQIGASSREVIATLSDVVWSIDARNDTIGNLIDRMRDFATDVLSPRQIGFHFEVHGLDMQRRIPVELRQNIYLIFKEAINNIAKHSKCRSVNAICRNTGGWFTMTIADDGQGMKTDGEGHGHGLRNMRMRAARIDGTLEILNAHGVTITLRRKEI